MSVLLCGTYSTPLTPPPPPPVGSNYELIPPYFREHCQSFLCGTCSPPLTLPLPPLVTVETAPVGVNHGLMQPDFPDPCQSSCASPAAAETHHFWRPNVSLLELFGAAYSEPPSPTVTGGTAEDTVSIFPVHVVPQAYSDAPGLELTTSVLLRSSVRHRLTAHWSPQKSERSGGIPRWSHSRGRSSLIHCRNTFPSANVSTSAKVMQVAARLFVRSDETESLITYTGRLGNPNPPILLRVCPDVLVSPFSALRLKGTN